MGERPAEGATTGKEPPKAFAREATGLVREISFFDHLMTNMNGVVPLAALALTPWWIWFAVPGGNPLLATGGGFLFSVIGSIVSYAVISATFPRSAAPYVANSRVLHPAIGWPAEMLMWLGWILALALYPSFMLTWGIVPGLYTMGVSTGNQALINAAVTVTQPAWVILIGVIFFAIALGVSIAGTRRLVRTLQLPMTIIMFIAIFVIIAYWVGSSTSSLDAVLPKYLGMNHSAITSYAHTSYPASFAPYSLAIVPVFFSIAFTAGSFNTYWNSWAAGEVRKSNEVRTHILAMVIPSALIAVVVGGVLAISYATVGSDFLNSLSNIMSNNISQFNIPALSGFSGSITMILIPMMLANNPIAQFIIMIGMIAATFAYVPATMLVISREWFAWSFDRLLPTRFAQVSDRFHTPVLALVVNTVVGFALFVVFTYYISYLGFFTTVAWDTTLVTVTVVCLSAAVLPLRKSIWQASPAKKYTIGMIPIATIGGLLGTFYNGLAVYAFTFTPILGFGLPSAYVLIATFVIPFILYWVVKAIRKRQGIDLNVIFSSIPPE
jgi:basic amino acid/polyamine antiporter, APA family